MGPQHHFSAPDFTREPRAFLKKSLRKPASPYFWCHEKQAQLCRFLAERHAKNTAEPFSVALGYPARLAVRVMGRDEILKYFRNQIAKAVVKAFVARVKLTMLLNKPLGVGWLKGSNHDCGHAG